MIADEGELDRLAELLWQNGVGAFCPTTLTSPPSELLAAVGRLGRWIHKAKKSKKGAIPLGIHLEGPFISPHACGAHPTSMIRPLDFAELDRLWEESQGTLKILTVAPEVQTQESLKKLVQWAKKRKIVLSLGHSKATEEQAKEALKLGFTQITHAWNAMGFQHRSPGPLGAALGSPNLFLELILDQIHVSPTVMRWTLGLHGHEKTCFVSDCAPAAGAPSSPEKFYSFGSLSIQVKDGASRLANGGLVGGGHLIGEMYRNWLKTEQSHSKKPLAILLKQSLPSLTSAPLKALGFSPKVLKNRQLRWKIRGNSIDSEIVSG
jgi:N-acetylglucosamine-6-phosphate deacetylase